MIDQSVAKLGVGVQDMGGWVRLIAGGTALQGGNLPFYLARRPSQVRDRLTAEYESGHRVLGASDGERRVLVKTTAEAVGELATSRGPAHG